MEYRACVAKAWAKVVCAILGVVSQVYSAYSQSLYNTFTQIDDLVRACQAKDLPRTDTAEPFVLQQANFKHQKPH